MHPNHTTNAESVKVALIPLHGKGSGMFALVDENDVERVSRYKWWLSGDQHRTYVLGYAEGERVLMHRLIMGAQPGDIIDHINSNGLDNRKANLRFCTTAQNSRNRRKHMNGSSEYIGVSWNKRTSSWRVSIRHHNERVTLGGFATEIEAALVRDALARQMHGEFASLNFPDRVYDISPLMAPKAEVRAPALPGRPLIDSTKWLQTQLEALPISAEVAALRGEWLRRYEKETGKRPADPRRSFRAAVSTAMRRIADRSR